MRIGRIVADFQIRVEFKEAASPVRALVHPVDREDIVEIPEVHIVASRPSIDRLRRGEKVAVWPHDRVVEHEKTRIGGHHEPLGNPRRELFHSDCSHCGVFPVASRHAELEYARPELSGIQGVGQFFEFRRTGHDVAVDVDRPRPRLAAQRLPGDRLENVFKAVVENPHVAGVIFGFDRVVDDPAERVAVHLKVFGPVHAPAGHPFKCVVDHIVAHVPVACDAADDAGFVVFHLVPVDVDPLAGPEIVEMLLLDIGPAPLFNRVEHIVVGVGVIVEAVFHENGVGAAESPDSAAAALENAVAHRDVAAAGDHARRTGGFKGEAGKDHMGRLPQRDEEIRIFFLVDVRAVGTGSERRRNRDHMVVRIGRTVAPGGMEPHVKFLCGFVVIETVFGSRIAVFDQKGFQPLHRGVGIEVDPGIEHPRRRPAARGAVDAERLVFRLPADLLLADRPVGGGQDHAAGLAVGAERDRLFGVAAARQLDGFKVDARGDPHGVAGIHQVCGPLDGAERLLSGQPVVRVVAGRGIHVPVHRRGVAHRAAPFSGQAQLLVGQGVLPDGDAADQGAGRGEHGAVFAVVPAASDSDEPISGRRDHGCDIGAFDHAAIEQLPGGVIGHGQRQRVAGGEAQHAFIPLIRLEVGGVFAEDCPDRVAFPRGNLARRLAAVEFIGVL